DRRPSGRTSPRTRDGRASSPASLRRLLLRRIERAHDLATKAVDLARAGIRDEVDGARLSRLEAYRGACGNVQTKAARLRAIEHECGIGFEEVIVRTDLNRPIARVGDFQRDRLAARVDLDVAVGNNDFARNHGKWTPTLASLAAPKGGAIRT